MGRLSRYRVNANVAGLRHGEVVEIDDDLDAWAPYIDRGILVPAPPPADETPLPRPKSRRRND